MASARKRQVSGTGVASGGRRVGGLTVPSRVGVRTGEFASLEGRGEEAVEQELIMNNETTHRELSLNNES